MTVPIADREAVVLRRALLWIATSAGLLGVTLVVLGVLSSGLRAGLVGGIGIYFSLWVFRERRAFRIGREGPVVRRVAIAILVLTPICAVIHPEVGDAVAVASMIPVVLAIVFLDVRPLRAVMALGAISGVTSFIGSRVVSDPASLFEPAHIIGIFALLAVYGILFTLLWTMSRRLKDGASDLRSVVAMSSDLTRTLDPQLVGNSIAAHVARAVGAAECGLNYLDADGDRLVAHGYFPPDRAQFVDPWYSADAYPATRRVIRDQVPYVAQLDDPDVDPDEAAFLRSIGQHSIAILPLVAAGRTVGTIEFTASRPGVFDDRAIELATMLATEAAMALENARLYDQIRYQAFHDGLTGLSNRSLFRDRIQHALDLAERRPGSMLAVLFIDLDDFKTLNDRLGHAGGDELLTIAAARLTACLRPGDTAARLGGDEFAVLLEGITAADQARVVADRIIASLAESVRIGDAAVSLVASIGIDLAEGATETVDDLLRNADAAMYAAKSVGGGRQALFQPELRVEAATRGHLARQLEGADERGELRLDYQPIVDMETGRISGVEALVRWQPADRPLLMPGSFIALAEATGAIHAIGRWVLREACRTLREWQSRLDLPDLTVSVNLTATQFDDPGIVELIRGVLGETGLPPRCLTIEITESGLMRNTPVTVERLVRLRELGVRVAIDDFGTGYSSLSYLERFPIDILKIDRSFISGELRGSERSVLAQVIVDLGRTLGLTVVAEGIETTDQAEWVRSIGCPYGQGFLFARPLGPIALEAHLAVEPVPVASMVSSRGSRDRLRSRARRARRAGEPNLHVVSGT